MVGSKCGRVVVAGDSQCLMMGRPLGDGLLVINNLLWPSAGLILLIMGYVIVRSKHQMESFQLINIYSFILFTAFLISPSISLK